MPRALALRYLDVSAAARAGYLARLTERVASAKTAAFHLWAFESAAEAGRFVEFVETGDAAVLDTALLHDSLFGKSLDFRHAPLEADRAPGGGWARFAGVADR